jgi:hypothetical protein
MHRPAIFSTAKCLTFSKGEEIKSKIFIIFKVNFNQIFFFFHYFKGIKGHKIKVAKTLVLSGAD